MSFTDYLETALLNHVFRATALTSPATIYAAAMTAAPGETGGGTEVTGGGYARQAVTFGAPTQVGGAATCASTAAVTFNRTGTAVTVLAVGYFDAATAGNLLAYSAITSSALGDGEVLNFPAGQLAVNLN